MQGRDRVNSRAQRQAGGWGEISVIFLLLPLLLHDFHQNHPNPVEWTQWEISSPGSAASLSSPKKACPEYVSWGKLRLGHGWPVCLSLPWCQSSSGSFVQMAIIICTFLHLMPVPFLMGRGWLQSSSEETDLASTKLFCRPDRHKLNGVSQFTSQCAFLINLTAEH